MEFLSRYLLGLILSFLSNIGLEVFCHRKKIQLMLVFLKDSYLVLHFSYYALMTSNDEFICNIVIYADNTALEQLELAFEVESDLQDIVDWSRKWPVDFIAGNLSLFVWSNNSAAIDVKIDGSCL